MQRRPGLMSMVRWCLKVFESNYYEVETVTGGLRMDIEKLAIKKDNNFDYRTLYSDSRRAKFKEDYKDLINEAISMNAITIEKFVIAENVEDELNQIIDTKGHERNLLRHLKNHHRELDHTTAPLIYMLKELDPDFRFCTENEKLEIVFDLFEVEIRPRIGGQNAEPRLFFMKEKIGLTSTNDDIGNLGDILAVKNVVVYAVGTDDYYNNIYAYKINRTDRYFEVAENF